MTSGNGMKFGMKHGGFLASGCVAGLIAALSFAGCSSNAGSSANVAGSESSNAGSESSNGGSSANGGATSNGGGATSNSGGSAGATQSGNAGSSTSTAGAGAGSPPPAKGLGTACATDADCTAPLACRFDTVDYTADMQCTAPCQSDDTCTTAFGKNSLCIGANICVHACTTDADCSAKTHCNIDGWCERTGPGSGVPYCTGIATPCAGQSDSACILSSGCTDNAKCSGLAEDCFDQFDDFSCTSLGGCFWDSLSMSCSGEAQTCDEMFDQLSCSLQIGCTWSGGCTGIPDTCESQFPSLCSDQPGCVLQTD